MSIDYFGHSSRALADAQKRVAHIRAAHPEWFDHILLLYDPRPTDGPFAREIAREFGIDAKTRFMLSVNDKERFSDCLREALEYVYEVFGTDSLVITWALDKIHPPLAHHPGLEMP